MPPEDCQGCNKCGTTFATGPAGHKPVIPHDLRPQFDRNTGEPDGSICNRCLRRVKP